MVGFIPVLKNALRFWLQRDAQRLVMRLKGGSKTIQTRYEHIARTHASNPLTTLKSIQNHLADLHMLGFLRRNGQNHGERGGRYYEYDLDLDSTIILDVRDDIETTHTT